MSDDALDIPDYMVEVRKTHRPVPRSGTYDWQAWPEVVVEVTDLRPPYRFLAAACASDQWRHWTEPHLRRRHGATALVQGVIVCHFHILDPHIAFEFKMKFA